MQELGDVSVHLLSLLVTSVFISRQVQVTSICKLPFCKYTSHSLQVVNCKLVQVSLQFVCLQVPKVFRQVLRQWQVGSLQRQVAFFISTFGTETLHSEEA